MASILRFTSDFAFHFRITSESIFSIAFYSSSQQNRMIGLFGLNHKSAPIEIREKFVFCEEDIRRFVPQLKEKGIHGAVVISTCNRTEIYFDLGIKVMLLILI